MKGRKAEIHALNGGLDGVHHRVNLAREASSRATHSLVSRRISSVLVGRGANQLLAPACDFAVPR